MDTELTIRFPVDDYPIRVIGRSDEALASSVVGIVRCHDPHFEPESVSLNVSGRGSYTSVRLSIRATGEAQLRALHQDLLAHPLVKLVL